MIIGFDASRAFSKNRTGTEEYSYQLLKHLSKIDSRNQYLIYTNPFINEPIGQLMKFPDNFKVVEIKWPRLWTQGGLAIQTFKDDLDVLFVPAHTLPIFRKPGLKTVVTVHDLGSEYLPKMHQLKQRLYLKWITSFQLNSATKLIAVSKATKDDLVKKVKCDPKKIEVIYEGYDNKLYKPTSGDVLVNRLRHFELVSGNYFLFVGTVQPRKNIERVISAFSILCHSGAKRSEAIESRSYRSLRSLQDDNLNLVIAGSKGWLSGEIYELPKRLGIEDRVKFLGYVREKDLPALYSGAIALTFPSLFEGFGLPILEAQACGCPVLTSNTSSMPEVAGIGAIFVDPYNIDEMANAMIEVVGKKKRSGLIKAGLENVARFSWEKCAKETLRVLEQVTSNK